MTEEIQEEQNRPENSKAWACEHYPWISSGILRRQGLVWTGRLSEPGVI